MDIGLLANSMINKKNIIDRIRSLKINLSIKARFIVLSSFSAILVVFLIRLVLGYSFESYLLNNLIIQSESTISTLEKNIFYEAEQTIYSHANDENFQKVFSGSYWQINITDNVVARSPSMWDAELSVATLQQQARTGFVIGPNNEPLFLVERLQYIPAIGKLVHFMVATNTKVLRKGDVYFSGVIITTTFIISIVMMLTFIISIAIALFPLDRLRVAILEVKDGNKRRIEGEFVKDLKPLVDAFNIVIDRYGKSIERARVYGANVAHGLKNPLAVIRLELDKSQDKISNNSKCSIEEQLNHMDRHIQLELARVRVAGAKAVPGQHCVAKKNLISILNAMQKLYRFRNIEHILKADSAVVDIEEQDFKEILGNIIDNAFKWATSCVTVSAVIKHEIAVISIIDDGPGVKNRSMKTLFKPGVRADQRRPGTGLGLTIAKDLLTMYGGKINLKNKLNSGLNVTITIPATSPYRIIKQD